MNISPNIRAVLNTIAWAEGTPACRLTMWRGYDVIVTGVGGLPEVFTDFSTHPFANGRPPKVINSKGLKSTAAGAHQQLLGNWTHYSQLLKLPDFSPASQDAIAIQQIKEAGGYDLLIAGKFGAGLLKIRHLWASLPQANYPDQPMKTYAQCLAIYTANGGIVST